MAKDAPTTVYYSPWVAPPPFFAKLTLNNGEVVELEGSGQLTSTMVSQYKNTLVSVEIGELCTRIGNYAFDSYRSLTSVTIPSSVTSIGNSAFCVCSGLTSITIPDSVTIINTNAFESCASLTSVTIGSGVTGIGQTAFDNCRSLTSIKCDATTAPTIYGNIFNNVKTGGTLTVPSGSTGYDEWMDYLGQYNWTKVEQ